MYVFLRVCDWELVFVVACLRFGRFMHDPADMDGCGLFGKRRFSFTWLVETSVLGCTNGNGFFLQP